MTLPFWSVHTHSRYSANDAMPKVPDVVARAAELGYPALGLTDHGNPSGSVQLYKGCRKVGIEPMPGIELYVTDDRELRHRSNDHLTVVSYSETGYRNLVYLSNLAAKNYWYKPRVDFADFAQMAEEGRTTGLAVATGCYFGSVVQRLINQGPTEALQVIKALAGWFPRTYVELQHHGIERQDNPLGYSEEDIIEELVYLSEQAGVPYIITQDSHYLYPEEQPLHDGLKTLVAFGEDPSEAQFPGDPYCMVDRAWMEPRFSTEVLETALANLDELAQKTSVRLPELEQFTIKVPDISKTGDPYRELELMVTEKLIDSGLAKNKKYTEPAAAELAIIKHTGIAGLLLVTWDACEFMAREGIWYMARGSANSSIVLNLIGITQVDPIAKKLRFDRFLSMDRTRMPDVDLDIEDQRRTEVIEYLESRYAVVRVGSHMQMGLTDDEDETLEGVDNSKGSLLRKYFTTAGKLGSKYEKWAEIPKEDQKMLRDLAQFRLISGPGTHAAGYILAPDHKTLAQLPVSWMASKSYYVTAYGKKDVEAAGYLKGDFLGLKTLTAMRICCELLAEQGGIMDGHPLQAWGTGLEIWENIPEDDPATMKRIREGRTDGCFQMDGKAQKFGLMDLKPKRLEDLIAGQALFRPATLKNGDAKEFIARRFKKRPVPERHGDIMAETKETYGLPIYQEQVIGLLRRIGMGPEELTDMLDAVKASNEASIEATKTLERARGRVHELATTRGWSETDVDWLVDALAGYGEYSFNRAHAAGYAITAYRTAYLCEHYPLEFWAGMLTAFQGAKRGKKDLEAALVSHARKNGVRVLPPHVNKSGVTYTVERDRGAVRKGLVSIKGVGPIAASLVAGQAPFASLTDMGKRVPSKVGGMKHLAIRKTPEDCGGVVLVMYEIGALDGLEHEPLEST